MIYTVVIKKTALKTLETLPLSIVKRIDKAIKSLKINPRPFGSIKLTEFDELHRIRVGDYRVLYSILDDILTIEVVKIGHRKEIYN